ESLRSLFHDECRDTPISGLGIGNGHGDANVGIVRVRCKGFGAIEYPLSIEGRPGAGSRSIRTCRRFSQSPTPQPLAGSEAGYVELALAIGTELIDVVRTKRGMRG